MFCCVLVLLLPTGFISLNFCNALLGGQCASEELGIIERLSGSRRTNLVNVEIYECVRLSASLCQSAHTFIIFNVRKVFLPAPRLSFNYSKFFRCTLPAQQCIAKVEQINPMRTNCIFQFVAMPRRAENSHWKNLE